MSKMPWLPRNKCTAETVCIVCIVLHLMCSRYDTVKFSKKNFLQLVTLKALVTLYDCFIRCAVARALAEAHS